MENVLLVISLICCIALIVAVLIQRSEGGALGMGGGGGGGGLMSGRGAADTLVRVTMVLAAVFFVTCLALTRIAAEKSRDSSEVIRTFEEEGVQTPLDLSDSPIEIENDVPSDLFDDTSNDSAESVQSEDSAPLPLEQPE